MRPNCFTASSTAAFACASLATSSWTNATLSPATSRKAFRTLPTFLAVATTRSPAFNAALAMPAPMPLPAPVINQALLIFVSFELLLDQLGQNSFDVLHGVFLENRFPLLQVKIDLPGGGIL